MLVTWNRVDLSLALDLRNLLRTSALGSIGLPASAFACVFVLLLLLARGGLFGGKGLKSTATLHGELGSPYSPKLCILRLRSMVISILLNHRGVVYKSARDLSIFECGICLRESYFLNVDVWIWITFVLIPFSIDHLYTSRGHATGMSLHIPVSVSVWIFECRFRASIRFHHDFSFPGLQ